MMLQCWNPIHILPPTNKSHETFCIPRCKPNRTSNNCSSRSCLDLFFVFAGRNQRGLSCANGSPYFVVILADDMGYSDIGCYEVEIQTPNIDALAEGVLRDGWHWRFASKSEYCFKDDFWHNQADIAEHGRMLVNGNDDPMTTLGVNQPRHC